MNQIKIGIFIKQCRKEKNLTQEELAQKLGTTSKSISRWENGNTMPDYSILKQLCDELNININELLTGEKIKENDYMIKAEENFINLKKKVDRMIKLLNVLAIISSIAMVILFILHTYFNWMYHGPWDDSKFLNISNILIWVLIFSTIFTQSLKQEIKKQ